MSQRLPRGMRSECGRRTAAIRHGQIELWCLLLVILSFSTLCTAQGDIINSTAYPYNIAGEVIAIAVGSYIRAAPGQPQRLSATVCEARCKATAGCSAWSYCNQTTGCVGQCREYLKRHTPLKADSKNSSRVSLSASLVRPGPFDPLCHPDARYSQNFNYGTCQLWRVQNPARPFFWSNRQSDGWISAVLQLPPACDGLSADTCQNCMASSAAAACLNCARRVDDGSRVITILGLNLLPMPSAACRMCFALTDPTTCVNCLVKEKPCGVCVQNSLLALIGADDHPGRFYNLAACINCTIKHGEKYFRVCDDCSRQGVSGFMPKCMTCIDQLKGRFCLKEKQETEEVKPNKACIPQGQCGLCARSSMYNECMQCALLKPYRRDCVSCMGLLGPADMTACLDCARVSQPGTGRMAAPCAECSLYSNRNHTASCYKCATRRDISGEGRNWCVSCTDWAHDPIQQQTCFNCLTKVKKPKDAAVCNRTYIAGR